VKNVKKIPTEKFYS